MSFSRCLVAAVFVAVLWGCGRGTSSSPLDDPTPIAAREGQIQASENQTSPTQSTLGNRVAQNPASSVPRIGDLPTTNSPDTSSSDADSESDHSIPANNAAQEGDGETPLLPAPPRLTAGDLPLRWPGPTARPIVRDARIADLQGKIARYGLFAAYRQLTEIYLTGGDYQSAARTLREEAGQYRRKGAIDAAIIEEAKASRYDSAIQFFIERAASPRELGTLYSKAVNEPFIGCYLGAFIDRDDHLDQTYMDENWQTHRTARQWKQVVGKGHGSLFMYLSYGRNFPTRWVAELKANGIIPHIAWEPKSLAYVRDDKYLNNFALACRAADWPIFIRFAGEMNGNWTPYHSNPVLYRQKFALVHRVLHRHAPRVATIWCVGNPPLKNVAAYYPGDNGCDWVGVNFYSVPFYENNPNRPALLDSPLTLLDPIYQMFAARKPIAICEYGASHRPALDKVLRNDFAISKMASVYGALPRLYPRVKLVDWFDMNSMRHPTPGKTLNDYTLTDQSAVMQAYRGVTASPYFLSRFQRLGDANPTLPRPLLADTKFRDVVRLSVWTDFQLAGRKVLLSVGERIVYASARPGAHEIGLDLTRFPVGRQNLLVAVYDARNRLVNSRQTSIVVTR